MNQEQWSSVDQYFSGVLAQTDDLLQSVLTESAAAGLPAISVAPNQGKLLQILAQSIGARKILEIGTLGGYSTIWMARALPKDGHLVTLEVDAKHAEVAKANIARAGLGPLVEIRLGSALETLPKLSAEGKAPFDFVFIDADKQNIPEYFAWSLKLSRPGSLIVVDNVVRDGAVIEAASSDPSVQGVRRLMEMVTAETRVSATAVQTVGSKGYDGFALIRVNS